MGIKRGGGVECGSSPDKSLLPRSIRFARSLGHVVGGASANQRCARQSSAEARQQIPAESAPIDSPSSTLIPLIPKRFVGEDYSLAIFDPSYKMLAGAGPCVLYRSTTCVAKNSAVSFGLVPSPR